MVALPAVLATMALSSVGQSVLIDFYADWCGPCRGMDPVVKQLAAQGYPIRQVNIDQDRALASRFNIDRIPCFVMLVDGREVARTVGPTSPERLVEMCRLATAGRGAAPPPAMLAQTAPSPAALQASWGPSGATCPVNHRPAANGTPFPSGPVKTDAELIAATVRLRIADPEGHSCGTGTIIDARQGQAMILTCGHLFRDSKGKGKIEVDLFGPLPAEKIPGKLLGYDIDREVGLVVINTPGPVAVAPLAAPGYRVGIGDPIVSVGCSNGDAPSVRRSRVTALGKYGGAPNLEIADLPVVGRSGGGLFTPEGRVIGVCNAADPVDREGVFTPLTSIAAELDRVQAAVVYREPSVPPLPVAVAVDPFPPPRLLPTSAVTLEPTAAAVAGPPTPKSEGRLPKLDSQEQAFLEKIHHELGQGAEVVCFIRPKNPEAKSEVMMLEQASRRLLERLNAEAQHRDLERSMLDLSGDRPAADGAVRTAGELKLR
jgi:thiol-disulfide isomerase/thioredoxin